MMPLPATREGAGSGSGTERFEEALTRLRGIVGEAHVRADPDSVARYSRDTIPWRRVCAAVVIPGTADEVREVVKVAAEFRLPLWPFSKGKNWGYGATMACHDGAIVLLLERLNRILEVNEELAYAVIEPGVTQGQLNAHLKTTGSKLWADCTDSTPHGSVLGNALERGVGYTPYGDHFGNLCGLEVVLPNGELLRTGGGPDHLRTRHTYKWGTGPFLDGLFSQSNCGIVTKAGLWLMPAPEAFACFVCNVWDEKEFPAAINALRRLALAGHVRSNVHIVNEFSFLTLVMQYPTELAGGRTCLSEEAKAELRRRLHLSPWTMTGGLYGSRGEVRAARRLVRQALAPYGSLIFLDDTKLARLRRVTAAVKKLRGIPLLGAAVGLLKNLLVSPAPVEVLEVFPQVYPIFQGVPSEFIIGCAYFKSRRGRPAADRDEARDGCGFVSFAPAVPATGRDVIELLNLCRPAFRKHGIDFAISFILVNPRTLVAHMMILYDTENPDETARVRSLYDELAVLTEAAGFQQYRTNSAFMDRILAGTPDCRRVAETIKSALDPDNILAPGRYGVGSA